MRVIVLVLSNCSSSMTAAKVCSQVIEAALCSSGRETMAAMSRRSASELVASDCTDAAYITASNDRSSSSSDAWRLASEPIDKKTRPTTPAQHSWVVRGIFIDRSAKDNTNLAHLNCGSSLLRIHFVEATLTANRNPSEKCSFSGCRNVIKLVNKDLIW